jgi:hypothetical protein
VAEKYEMLELSNTNMFAGLWRQPWMARVMIESEELRLEKSISNSLILKR